MYITLLFWGIKKNYKNELVIFFGAIQKFEKKQSFR